MFKEEDMQSAIEKRPDLFFGEGVKVYEREAMLGSANRIDFILEDTNRNIFLLVEIMRGYLDDEHAKRMWTRYIPSFEKLRSKAKYRSILVSNFISPRLESECKMHNVETKTFRVDFFRNLDLPDDTFKGIRKAACDSFEGFTLNDFLNLVEADRQLSTELRLPQVGKLYQLQDYLSPHLETIYPNMFLDAKVSNKKYPQRLGIPWMAYYFGAVSEGSSGNPHINITLAEESENGRFIPTECSVHCNAELASSFSSVMSQIETNSKLPVLIDHIRNKGLEFRFYSKVPIKPQSANDNYWTFRKSFSISSGFKLRHIPEWFAEFEKNNNTYLKEDIERLSKTFGEQYTRFAKRTEWSASGRSVIRLGKWWKTDDVANQGSNFQESVLETIKSLVPFFEIFKG